MIFHYLLFDFSEPATTGASQQPQAISTGTASSLSLPKSPEVCVRLTATTWTLEDKAARSRLCKASIECALKDSRGPMSPTLPSARVQASLLMKPVDDIPEHRQAHSVPRGNERPKDSKSGDVTMTETNASSPRRGNRRKNFSSRRQNRRTREDLNQFLMPPVLKPVVNPSNVRAGEQLMEPSKNNPPVSSTQTAVTDQPKEPSHDPQQATAPSHEPEQPASTSQQPTAAPQQSSTQQYSNRQQSGCKRRGWRGRGGYPRGGRRPPL